MSRRAVNVSARGPEAQLQAAQQRLCAVLTIKLVRRLLELESRDLAAQVARSVTLITSRQCCC